jgi:hypothetical protein
MKLICDNGSFAFYCWKSWDNLTFLNRLTEQPCCVAWGLLISISSVLGIHCYGDLLEDRLFNGELYETVTFIRLFNGGDFKVQVTYSRTRIDNVIMISELVKDVGESIVANINYGISVQVQRKTTGNLIQGSRLYDLDFNLNQLNVNQERFL